MNPPPCMVWLPADHRLLGDHGHQMPFLLLGDKYARAVKVGAQAQPVMFPLAEPDQISELLSMVDGVMLTGSPSNVHPSHFDEDVADPTLPLDPARDTLTLALVKACVHEGVPLLGVCRGFQEINVALGGTLHQAVQEQPGLADHRAPEGRPAAEQYAPSHSLQVQPGGVLEQLLGAVRIEVNSLHGQGVDRLAPGLRVEAVAPDGLVEAFSVIDAPGFNLCVQWHPEWQAATNPVSMALLRAFGSAVRQYRDQYRDRVRGPLPSPASTA